MTSKTKREPDFIAMACTSASVPYREVLTPDELVRALASGQVPRNRFAHFCMLFEEAPEVLLHGLVEQVSETSDRSIVMENIFRIAREMEVTDRVRKIFGG
jgi:hypothetical protein